MSQAILERRSVGETRDLLWLAVPIIVSQLGQTGMSTADTIMVGPLGPASLAATGLASALHIFGVVLCTGILIGTGPLVSQAFGAGDRRQCHRVFVHGIWVALLLSAPLMASCLVGEPLARWLNQDAEVSRLVGAHLRALTWGVPPLLLYVAFRQWLEGMGRTQLPMLLTFLGFIVNVLFNWLLIYGVEGWIPAMGVVGSGYATTLARWSMLIALLVFLLATRPASAKMAPWRPSLLVFEQILGIGVPIGAQLGLEVGIFSFAAVMAGWIGPAELAAHQVTINIASATFMVALGVSLAGSIRVGQHIGAGRPELMREAVRATYLLSAGFMGVCALMFLLLPEALIRLYTQDSAIIDIGVPLMLVAAAFQIFDGAQVAGMAVLRGAGDTRIPMLIAGIGYWAAGLPISYLLAFGLKQGAVGIWSGLCVGIALVAVLLARRVRRVLWEQRIEAVVAPAASVAE